MLQSRGLVGFFAFGLGCVFAVAGCVDGSVAEPREKEVVDTKPARVVPPRAPVPWEERVAELERQFRENPGAPKFSHPPVSELVSGVTSLNESAPVEGVLLEWWCDWQAPDAWDTMWMRIIGESVRSDSDVYVYLVPARNSSPQVLLEQCGNLLAQTENIALDRVQFIQGVATNAFWLRDFGPMFVRDVVDSALRIRDPRYYWNRQLDDNQPIDFAQRIAAPISEFPLRFEGGNFKRTETVYALLAPLLAKPTPNTRRKRFINYLRRSSVVKSWSSLTR